MKRHWYPQDNEAKGYVRISWQLDGAQRFDAKWDEDSGELTLSTDERLVLVTRDPGAFDAGLRLLTGDGTVVVFHGFTLLSRGPRLEWTDYPPPKSVTPV